MSMRVHLIVFNIIVVDNYNFIMVIIK